MISNKLEIINSKKHKIYNRMILLTSYPPAYGHSSKIELIDDAIRVVYPQYIPSVSRGVVGLTTFPFITVLCFVSYAFGSNCTVHRIPGVKTRSILICAITKLIYQKHANQIMYIKRQILTEPID